MNRFLVFIIALALVQITIAGSLTTSFVNLLVYPNELDGKEVSVFAYLGPQGKNLYLTRDHAVGGDLMSSVRVYHSYEKRASDVFDGCINRYVYVTGVFNKDTTHRMAGLSQLTRMYVASEPMHSCGNYK